jgi:hypothetical protein
MCQKSYIFRFGRAGHAAHFSLVTRNHLHRTNTMNDQSAATARDYDSHTPSVSPAVVHPSRAPLPRLNEGAFRRAARVLPFGAISNLRAGEVPRAFPFSLRPLNADSPMP